MAKDKNKSVATTAVNELTNENIAEQIKGANNLNADYFTKAAEEIAKEKDERGIAEAKEIIGKITYVNKRALLDLRKDRKVESATKKFLEGTKTLLDKVSAGDANYTKIMFDKEYNELKKSRDNELAEIRKEYDVDRQELRRNFSCWDVYRYDYDM